MCEGELALAPAVVKQAPLHWYEEKNRIYVPIAATSARKAWVCFFVVVWFVWVNKSQCECMLRMLVMN